MPSYAVDSGRQSMMATGIVEEVVEWKEGANGKRIRTDVQARHADTGMPLWAVEVIYRIETWGREYTATAMVQVGGQTRPAPGFFTRISFDALQVEVRVNKAGGLVESWRAETIAAIEEHKTGPTKVAS